MPIKISNDTIGNRARDLPVCSAVPQPTALARASVAKYTVNKLQNLRVKEELKLYV